jgi:hypothetical protein
MNKSVSFFFFKIKQADKTCLCNPDCYCQSWDFNIHLALLFSGGGFSRKDLGLEEVRYGLAGGLLTT